MPDYFLAGVGDEPVDLGSLVDFDIPDERLVYAGKHPSIIFLDEADRGRPEIWGAVCAGLAATPMAIGGVELGTSRAIFAINGETDMGCIEMPEAIRQRVVFIYLRPQDGEWLNYQRGVTSLPDGLLTTLDASNRALCVNWVPTDLAADAQAFERSATFFCQLASKYLGLREAGKYNGLDADKVLDALAIGQLGSNYWTSQNDSGHSPRDAFFAAATLADCGVDSDAVLGDPTAASLPPDGLWRKAVSAVCVIANVDDGHVQVAAWIDRFPNEGKAALKR